MNEKRERFETWAKKNKDKDGNWLLVIKNDRGDYIDDSTYTAWEAWKAACPDGWQCVPKDLDEGMTESVMWAVDKSRLQGMWTDLLSAAPKPGEL